MSEQSPKKLKFFPPTPYVPMPPPPEQGLTDRREQFEAVKRERDALYSENQLVGRSLIEHACQRLHFENELRLATNKLQMMQAQLLDAEAEAKASRVLVDQLMLAEGTPRERAVLFMDCLKGLDALASSGPCGNFEALRQARLVWLAAKDE